MKSDGRGQHTLIERFVIRITNGNIRRTNRIQTRSELAPLAEKEQTQGKRREDEPSAQFICLMGLESVQFDTSLKSLLAAFDAQIHASWGIENLMRW